MAREDKLKRLNPKNLRRYAHTQGFNRLAGKKALPPGMRSPVNGRAVGIFIIVGLLLILAIGGYFVIF